MPVMGTGASDGYCVYEVNRYCNRKASLATMLCISLVVRWQHRILWFGMR